MSFADGIGHTEYRRIADELLASYAKVYSHFDPPYCHNNPEAARLSFQIKHYVQTNWKEDFELDQFPLIQRKGFPTFDREDKNT